MKICLFVLGLSLVVFAPRPSAAGGGCYICETETGPCFDGPGVMSNCYINHLGYCRLGGPVNQDCILAPQEDILTESTSSSFVFAEGSDEKLLMELDWLSDEAVDQAQRAAEVHAERSPAPAALSRTR